MGDDLKYNKIFAAVLLALLLGKVFGLLSEKIISPKPLAKTVLVIEGVEEEPGAAASVDKGPEPVEPLLAKANVENGKQIAKKCVQCHTFEKGGPNKIGPNQWGIVGAKFGHAEGFAYSNDIKSKEGHWTYENLNVFLHKPRAFIKGTKMAFAGLSKAQDRADLIAYLRTLNDNPPPLPK